jgi:transposase-like protein
MAKRRYSEHFRQVAVERMRGCESIVALTKELGVSRRQLCRWRDELDPGEPAVGKPPGQKSRVSTLRKEVNHLNLQLRSDPDNANSVLANLSPHDGKPPSMPPGEPYWTSDQLALFAQWQKDGYRP